MATSSRLTGSHASYQAALAAYPVKMEMYIAEKAKWDHDIAPAYNAALDKWKITNAQALAADNI